MTSSVDPDNISRIVVLTYGPTKDGKDAYWCYVAVKPSEYDRFNANLQAGKIDPQTFEEDGYGEIVVSGDGLLPPQEVTQKVAHMFNIPINQLFKSANPAQDIENKINSLAKDDSNKDN